MQFKHKVITHAFTTKGERILNVLVQEIEITPFKDPSKAFKTRGIWDTGASHTVITKEVVAKLGLSSTGVTQVNTASETNRMTSTYLVDIKLKQDLTVTEVRVTEGTILNEHGIDCLIGMDIITLGDFAITNIDQQTWMSFRIPSQHRVDFVDKINREMAVINRHFAEKRSMNSVCVCGSGKKFKNCHGRNLEST